MLYLIKNVKALKKIAILALFVKKISLKYR